VQFKKGHIPWNKKKPYKHSEETKRKISLAKKGIPCPEEHKRRVSKTLMGKYVGEKSGNWKGGITPINKMQRIKFRDTMQKQVLERDNYTCQMCGVRGASLQVDHIQPWSEYVEGRFDMNNCRTLYVECHYEITFGRPMPKDVKTWGRNLVKGGDKHSHR
jgi:hypothetical protein